MTSNTVSTSIFTNTRKHITSFIMASSSTPSTPLLYSCIAYKSTILAEHTASTSSATSNLANVILPKIDHASPEKRTYVHGSNNVHYIADAAPSSSEAGSLSAPGLTYLVVSPASLGRRIPFGYLIQVKTDFLAKFPPGTTAPPRPGRRTPSATCSARWTA